MEYSEAAYAAMTERLFVRFPSFQKVGGQAYKPGIDNMLFFDQMAGHPHRKYVTVHVAGTNGKGSVSNMLASVLAAAGLKTGLYTSPHILDFRERMRILDGRTCKLSGPDAAPGCRDGKTAGRVDTPQVEYIGKKAVWDFVTRWDETFGHLDLSFFEITTMMAFDWFASQNVDAAVIETGLGGRFDSTNIISPALSIITNIGLDHCDMLGCTLGEIAFEKAGIIKPRIPAVIGESNPETDPVFERKVLYTNLSDPEYMGDRKKIMSLLTFADKTEPAMWQDRDKILHDMDLQGEYQKKNLRTVLASVGELASDRVTSIHPVLKRLADLIPRPSAQGQARTSDTPPGTAGSGSRRNAAEEGKYTIESAIEHTAARMDFHGRWERLRQDPLIIADIGHNAHGLKYNFAQLERSLADGTCTHLIIIYGIVADKDLDAIFPLMPEDAGYIFTNSSGKRAMPAGELLERYLKYKAVPNDAENGKNDARHSENTGNGKTPAESCGTVASAVGRSLELARRIKAEDPHASPLIYIGGSTFIVSEAIEALKKE